VRYLSLCSGIEAASVAWQPLGWTPVAFAEIEAFPSAVLKHHYPDVPNLGDITKFKEWPDYAVDVVCGGTPCQSFSVAGLRKGLADPRGNLSLTFLAIVDGYRPAYVIWENVPGVLSSDGGRDFAAFLGGLGQLGFGWCYRVLDAQYVRVDGLGRAVPQRRRRVFVVGYIGDWRRAAAVLSEPESVLGDTPPRREAGQGTATTTKVGFGGGRTSGSLDVAASLAAHGVRQDFEVETFIAHSLRAEGFDASEDGTGRGTPLVPIAFSAKDHGADAMDNLSPTLRAGGHHTSHANAGVMPAIAIQKRAIRQDGAADTLEARQVPQAVAFTVSEQANGFAWERDVWQTLDAQVPNDTSNIQRGIRQGWAVRRLTPRECERLQGFPDDYTLIPHRGKPAADGPRYKALGNSWAVNCARWIGRRIEMVEHLSAELQNSRAA
jgi:DNA (cytosine-5)-methyltransferase 1